MGFHRIHNNYENMNAIVSYRVSYLGHAIPMALYLLKLDNIITICSLIWWRAAYVYHMYHHNVPSYRVPR